MKNPEIIPNHFRTVQEAYRSMNEAKKFKKGEDVWYIDPDGAEKEATILSYNKKFDEYMIDVKGNEMIITSDQIEKM